MLIALIVLGWVACGVLQYGLMANSWAILSQRMWLPVSAWPCGAPDWDQRVAWYEESYSRCMNYGEIIISCFGPLAMFATLLWCLRHKTWGFWYGPKAPQVFKNSIGSV